MVVAGTARWKSERRAYRGHECLSCALIFKTWSSSVDVSEIEPVLIGDLGTCTL